MKGKRIQQIGREKSKVESFLDYLLDIPTTIYFKLGLLVVLFVIGFFLVRLAARQYSPVVHRIHIGGANWKEATSIDIEAGLSTNKKNGREEQYLQFFATTESVPAVTSVPEEVTKAVPGTYTNFSTTTLIASGTKFDIPVPANKWGDWSDNMGVTGPSRCVRSKDGHTVALENYRNGSSSSVDLVIEGEDIFSDSRSKNPYIAFHLTFDESIRLARGRKGYINCWFSREKIKTNFSEHYSSPLRVVSINPEPDEIHPDYFGYDLKLNDILYNGLYVILEDLSMKRRNDLELFISSVFLGVVVSFFVQLLVSLIRDIRDEQRSTRIIRERSESNE